MFAFRIIQTLAFLFSMQTAFSETMDLSKWDGGKCVPLSNYWYFIPSQFVDSAFHSYNYYPISVGESWNGYSFGDSTMSGRGEGTYFIKLFLPRTDITYELDLGTVSSSYSLFVNQDLIRTVGTPSLNMSEVAAQYNTNIISFRANEPETIIVLHVSNFDLHTGGMWQIPYLSFANRLTMKRRFSVGMLLLLFGGVFIIGFYHFGIFILRKRERASLYFFLWTFFASFRLLFSGRYFPILDFVDVPFDVIIRAEYFTFYAAIPLFIKYVYEVFPIFLHKKLVHLFMILGLGFSLFVWCHSLK